MTKIELGRIGAALAADDGGGYLRLAAQLEDLGYSTLSTGGPTSELEHYRALVQATRQVRVTGSIMAVDRFDADAVIALYRDLESSNPGRLVLGLGGAHGPQPFATLNAYLDRLDAASIPATRRFLAALGPRMLDLARDRSSGALPLLVTPAYTAQARARLGNDRTLAIDQFVVVETDPERARSLARGPVGGLGSVPAYQANFRRMGFGENDIAQVSDRLVDALVAWGDAATVAARVGEHLSAGADHVLINLVADPAEALSPEPYRQLAEQLALG